MMRRISLKTLSLIAVGVLCFVGCQTNHDKHLVVIKGHDAITVNQFNLWLEKKHKKNILNMPYSEKRTYLESLVQERLKLIYAKESGLNAEIVFDEEKEKYKIMVRHAYEKYIIGHFITEEYVQKYMQNYGATIRVQNIVIRFKDRENSSAKLTIKEAQWKADSVYTLIRTDNFEAIADKHSEYFINPYSKKANIFPDKMKIGQMPINYEQEVLRLKPFTISRPIEIQGAYAISRLIDYDYDTKQVIDSVKAKDLIKARLYAEDNVFLLKYQNMFLDSLYESAEVKLADANIEYMIRKLSDTVMVTRPDYGFSADELEKSLAEFGSEQLRIKDFFQRNSPGKTASFKFEAVKQIIKEQCKYVLLAQLSLQDGFVGSDSFLAEMESAKNVKLLDRLSEQLSKNISAHDQSDLMKFYVNNRYRYRTEGSIVWSELYTSSKDKISAIVSALKSGVAFEKIPEVINTNNSKPEVKINSNISSAYTQRGELTRVAQRMEINEISDIVPRKDGGYSIIKIVSKVDPTLIPYEKVEKKIKIDYRNDAFKKADYALISQLCRRWKVVVYENNLK